VITVSVPERGEAEVGPQQWAMLRREPALWDLVEARTLGVQQRRGGGVCLTGSSNVGRALCGDAIIECREKVPGALLALLRTVDVDFRTLPVPSPMTELGDTIALILSAFVAEVRRYVGAGREWQYEERRMVSSLAGGRLIVPATISLRSRGMRHLIAFDSPSVTRAIEINKVVFAALREAEVIARLVTIDSTTLAAARAMSLFFEDCREAGSMHAPRSALVQRVNELQQDPRWSAHRRMLAFAGVLMSHGSLEAVSPVAASVPLSWFVNLENLFERAVRQELATVCGSDVTVSEGNSFKRMVFPAVGANQANPDLVVQTASSTVVGDVKYKTWTQSASSSDLYQLLVHASAFEAQRAFLIYPSDQFDVVELNMATTGVQVWLFAVDIRRIESDLRRVSGVLGLQPCP